MSWLKALVVTSLLAFSVEASAGGRVDWSDYIDHDAKPTPRTSSSASSEPAPVAHKKAKARKVSKKKVATKNRKARSKKSRRK